MGVCNNCCSGLSPVPFHKRGSSGARFFRDICCIWIAISVIVIGCVIIPLLDAAHVPLYDLPERTAVFHSSPTKKAALKAANEDPLLRAFIVQTEKADEQAAQPKPTAAPGPVAPRRDHSADAGFKGCRGPTDQKVWKSGGLKHFTDYMNECGNSCTGRSQCVRDCITKTGTFKQDYSKQCVTCFSDLTDCSKNHCMTKCLMSPDGKPCAKCVRRHCNPKFGKCSGFDPKTLPSHGTKKKGSLLNIEGELVKRRMLSKTAHPQLFSSEGAMSFQLSSAFENMERHADLDTDFDSRPVCRDDNKILAIATNGKVNECQKIQHLCQHERFGKSLRIACPVTCDALSPKCANCRNDPSILQDTTNGKVRNCEDASVLCTNPQFGAAIMEACPISCDSCGVVFSTPPPTPAPVKDEKMDGQQLIFEKTNDGSLAEDAVTAIINVATKNPKGPKDAMDAWGYIYGLITLASPYLTVEIMPALVPIVWHRPAGVDFDYTLYPPYCRKAGTCQNPDENQKKNSKDADDDKEDKIRRLQDDGQDYGDATMDGGYAGGEQVADGGVQDTGYANPGQEWPKATKATLVEQTVPGVYTRKKSAKYSAWASGDPNWESAKESDCGEYLGAVQQQQSGDQQYGRGLSTAKKPSDFSEEHRKLCDAQIGSGFISTTIAHFEFPRETIRPSVTNTVVLGVSAHLTNSFLETNRDVLEAIAYPIATPQVKQMLAKEEAPAAFEKNMLGLFDIPAMGRPPTPDIVLTFGGKIPMKASAYCGLWVSADVAFMCQSKIDPDAIAKGSKPDVDCGAIGMGNVHELVFLHNSWILGACFFVSFFIVSAVWCFNNNQGCFGSSTGSAAKSTPIPSSVHMSNLSAIKGRIRQQR